MVNQITVEKLIWQSGTGGSCESRFAWLSSA